MKTSNVSANGPEEIKSEGLREKLAANRKKLEALSRQIGEKNEELAMLKLEIEELNKLYVNK